MSVKMVGTLVILIIAVLAVLMLAVNIFAIFLNYIKGQVAIYLFSIQGGVFMYAGMESQYGGEWWAGFKIYFSSEQNL